MGDVKRYNEDWYWDYIDDSKGMWVKYDDHAALVSSLREELAEFKRVYIASTGREAELKKRLAAAEPRNADVEKRAADLIECLWGIELPGAGNPRLRKLKRALEALKPTESGASE